MAVKECQCHLLTRLVLGGCVLEGLRCPACLDAILEAKNQVVRELQGEEKARDLLLKGMESQAEICDGLKQSNRAIERELSDLRRAVWGDEAGDMTAEQTRWQAVDHRVAFDSDLREENARLVCENAQLCAEVDSLKAEAAARIEWLAKGWNTGEAAAEDAMNSFRAGGIG